MSSVDDRIVNMQFNNKQFTQGAAESQRALEGLDKTLANTGKGSGLTTMGSAVDGISAKFSAMQVAGVAAFGTIVSKATTAGLGLIKSLTLDPITQGFGEYTTNLNSIQTVMANTGEDVNTVNGYMQKLNTYSDQTIYNFSQMAKNIGTFTAAGVDLATATASIQGIANIAALSGSSADQASTAMYQLSQAIAAGRVGLMDWNSVVNAGMGGKVFQTALTRTAAAMGTISKAAIGSEGPMQRLTINGESFRNSISAAGTSGSWLTSDVLVNTLASLDGRFSRIQLGLNGYSGAAADAQIQQARLNLEQKLGVKYTDEQFKSLLDVADKSYEAATVVKTLPQLLSVVKESIGSIWANTFQILLGNFEQSKALWSSVSKQITGPSGFITKMGSAWTGLLRSFVETGGRTKVLSGLGRIFRNLGKVMGALKGAFSDIFPPASGNALKNISKGFNQFTRYLILNKDTISNLRTIFGGFFSILHIGFELIKGAFKLVGNVFKAVLDNSDGASGGLLSLVASVAKVITAFDKWLTAGGRVSETMGDIGTAIGSFIGPVLAGIGAIIKAFASLVSGGGVGGLSTQFISIQTVIEAFQSSTESGMKTLKALFSGVSAPLDQLSSVLGSLKDKMDGLLQSGGGVEGIFRSISAAAGSAAASGLQIASGIVSGVAQGISSAAPEIWSAVSALAESIVETFKSVLGIHSPSTAMIDPGFNVVEGIVEGIFKGIALIGHAITAVAGALKAAFTQLFGDMDALDFAALINSIISGGFLLALTNILNTVGNAGFFSGFANIFDQLSNSLQAFQQNLKAQALLAIGTAVALLVGSLILLALLDPAQIGQGLGTIAVMMGLLVGSMAALSKTTKGGVTLVFISGALNEMATSILILSGAIAVLGNLDQDTINQGMAAMALSLALMVGAARALSGISGQLIAAGAAMLLMAVGMQAVAVAVLMFGNLDPDTLSQGMSAMAIGLALMVGALRALGSLGPSIALAGAAMFIVAVAMQAMAVAVLMFGKMDPDTLSQGLKGLAISIALMTVSLIALSLMGPAVLTAAASMALMAAAMVVMASAVGTLGAMDPDVLAQGLEAVAIALALLLVAALGAQFVAVGLLALGASIALLGLGVALAGAGMLAFATALSILAVVGVAAIAIMVVAIEAFTALLPSIAVQVAAAFVSFLETLADASPRIREALGTIFEDMIGIVTDAIPVIGNLFQQLITTSIGILKASIPQYIEMGLTIIDKFLEGLARHIPNIAKSVGDLVVGFVEAFDGYLQDLIAAGTDLVVHFLEGLARAVTEISEATAQMILDILHGIDAAVQAHTTEIRDAGLSIAKHLLEGLTAGLSLSSIKGALGNVAGDVGSVVGGLIPGRRAADSRNPIPGARHAVQLALTAANANELPDADRGLVAAAQKAQTQADQRQAAAALAAEKAKAATKAANDKKLSKAAKKAAEKKAKDAQRIADHLASNAQISQDKADSALQRASDSSEFNQADAHGKGDILDDRASTLADRANQVLQKANAEAKQAKELMKTNKEAGRAMLEQAKKDASEAAKLAKLAQAAQQQANAFYAQEVRDRIKQLEDDAAAEAQAKADAAAYEAADDAGKAKILQARADADHVKADLAKAEATRLIQLAKDLAATDPIAAMKALDEAEKQAQIAKDAAEKAEQERQQAEQILNGGGGTAGTGGGIQPSKSVLEDAARAVDRFSQSFLEAQAAAGATQAVVQYNQNVYSPAALSPSEVYRQSKNLLSAHEIKMGAGFGNYLP